MYIKSCALPIWRGILYLGFKVHFSKNIAVKATCIRMQLPKGIQESKKDSFMH